MRAADLTPVARDVMKGPAGAGLIFFSLAIAYLICVLPWSGAWLLARPDLVFLLLLFWAVHEPRSVGQGVAFALGLLMDVSESMVLGQHAFDYVVGIFGAQVLRLRILSFQLPAQTMHVLALTLAASLATVALNLLLGGNFPGWGLLVSPLLTALLWAPAHWLMFSPAVRRRRRRGGSS